MIEELNAKLVDVKSRASIAERELADSRCRADLDIARLQDELLKLRDRYDRFSYISVCCKVQADASCYHAVFIM